QAPDSRQYQVRFLTRRVQVYPVVKMIVYTLTDAELSRTNIINVKFQSVGNACHRRKIKKGITLENISRPEA
ncbi:MAG: hypothetical protein PVJ78_16245, partial [Gammaproteobacteria bacterium]